MPKARPWPELPDVFRGSVAVSERLLTPSQLRSPLLRRLFQDVYAPRYLLHDHLLECRGAALIAPPSARLTGTSLATALGASLAQVGDEVQMVVPAADWGQGPRGILLRGASRGPLGTELWRGVPVTTSLRMGFDLAARYPLGLAVGHLDVVARARLLDVGAFRSWLEKRHEDDVVHVREAASLIDARAESIPESRVRVLLLKADIEVEPQFKIWVGRRFIGRVDLAIIALKIAIEYEGKWRTLLAGQLSKDRERLDALQSAGWKTVHITADALRERGAVVDAVRRAIAERAAEQLPA